MAEVDCIADSKVSNGEVGVVPKNEGGGTAEVPTCNGNLSPDVTETQPKSSTPVTLKKNVPELSVEDEDEEDSVVKSKPHPGHSRKGSSISQFSMSGNSSTCSISRENSFLHTCPVNSDTISLPLTLEQLKKDTSVRTTSDPALKLTADLSRDDLSDEQRHETLTKLLEEVVALKLEIVNLKEENETLRRARSDMDNELHQLTENLFEEAYKMVDEAKGGKANAEKRLLDAAGQIEAMETKVHALNNLLHTKPPQTGISPNSIQKHKKPLVKKMIKRISRKSTKKISEQRDGDPLLKCGELRTEEYKSFNEWVELGLPLSASEVKGNCFATDVLEAQITPCLTFKNQQLSAEIKEAIVNNMLVLEPLAGVSVDDHDLFKQPCALTSESAYPCSYRMKLNDGVKWWYISSYARNRIVSVCDFYLLVSYVQKGIVKKESIDLYWQMVRHRGTMSLSLLNLGLQDPTPTPLLPQ